MRSAAQWLSFSASSSATYAGKSLANTTAVTTRPAIPTAILGGLAARRYTRDETHLHHLALAFAPYLASFGLLWFPYLVTALPLMVSTLHRALDLRRAQTRGALIAALALSWLLLQVVGERNDLVPILAHFIGLVVLLAVALAVLAFARQGDMPETVAARVAA